MVVDTKDISDSMCRKIRHLDKLSKIDNLLASENIRQKSPINRQAQKLAKAHSAFHIYRINNQLESSFQLAKDLCKTAKKYGFPKFYLEPAEFLFRYHSQYKFSRPKAQKALTLYNECQNAYNLELECNTLYSKILLAERSKHSKNKLPTITQKSWERISPHLGVIHSFEFHKIGFMIGVYYARYNNKPKENQSIAEQAVKYFENYILKSPPIIAVYYRHLINAHFALGDIKMVQNLLPAFKENATTKNSQALLYLYTIVRIKCMRNEFNEARDIAADVVTDPRFKRISQVNKLAFYIVAEYLNYLDREENDKIELSSTINKAKEEDVTTEDLKIQLLVIKLIYNCFNREWKSIDSNASAITKYLNRKLIRHEQRRSYYFIKMLLELPKHQFHPAAVDRHTKKYLYKIKATPSNTRGTDKSPEIIPYEHLWELIMENLKRKHHKR